MKQIPTYVIVHFMMASLLWASAITFYYYAATDATPSVMGFYELVEENETKENCKLEDLKNQCFSDLNFDFVFSIQSLKQLQFLQLQSLHHQEIITPPPETKPALFS